MPISVQWDDPDHTILLISAVGTWTLEMFRESYLEAQSFMETVNHPIAMIVDMRKGANPPDGYMSVTSLHREIQANTLIFATFVGASRIMMVFANLIFRLAPRKGKFLFSASLEDARTLCRERLASET